MFGVWGKGVYDLNRTPVTFLSKVFLVGPWFRDGECKGNKVKTRAIDTRGMEGTRMSK